MYSYVTRKILHMITTKQLLFSVLIATSAATAWCMEDLTEGAQLLTYPWAKNILQKYCCREIIKSDDFFKRYSQVFFHPNGKMLISNSDKSIDFWDLETYQCVKSIDRQEPVRISPIHPHPSSEADDPYDLHNILMYMFKYKNDIYNRCLYIYNPDQNEWDSFLIGDDYPINAFAASPCGKYITTGSSQNQVGNNGLRIWDVRNKVLLNWILQDISVNSLTYKPDGKQIAVLTEEMYGKYMTLLDVQNQTVIVKIKMAQEVNLNLGPCAYNPTTNQPDILFHYDNDTMWSHYAEQQTELVSALNHQSAHLPIGTANAIWQFTYDSTDNKIAGITKYGKIILCNLSLIKRIQSLNFTEEQKKLFAHFIRHRNGFTKIDLSESDKQQLTQLGFHL